jgi:hypothetical protein
MHEMFVRMDSVVIERHVFSLLLEMKVSGGRKPLGQGRLAVKLMRKLLGFDHGQRVRARGLRESGIERERGRSCLLARLVG